MKQGAIASNEMVYGMRSNLDVPTVASKIPRKKRAVMRPLKSVAAAVLATTIPQRKTLKNTKSERC